MENYRVLTDDEKDEMLVSFLLSHEREKYADETSLGRLSAMLEVLGDSEWKKRIRTLKAETEKRLTEVNSIIDATLPQMPSQERIRAALARLGSQKAANLSK